MCLHPTRRYGRHHRNNASFDLVLAEDVASGCDGFIWTADNPDIGLLVRTYNNPLTGEHTHERRPEEGYASYIHVAGSRDTVKDFYKAARLRADYVKDCTLGRYIV